MDGWMDGQKERENGDLGPVVGCCRMDEVG